jgi:hypothetical protein
MLIDMPSPINLLHFFHFLFLMTVFLPHQTSRIPSAKTPREDFFDLLEVKRKGLKVLKRIPTTQLFYDYAGPLESKLKSIG